MGCTCFINGPTCRSCVDGLQARATAAEQRVKVLEEALTPSGDTKAAYIGEFSWSEPSDDHWGTATRTVPWDTVKDIMAAILSRANAALSRKDTQ